MSFKRIVSQQNVIKILKGTLERNRVIGAFLFIGDPFIGKTTTAIEYAKALNCYNLENADSCDNCISCKKIEKSIHPDFKKISVYKDVITIENIREIEEFLSLQPLEGKYKVVILKNAEKMNRSAANAFLKTLEEPPINTVIILTCENVDSLPEPLVSRTFKVYFKPLSAEALQNLIDSEDKNQQTIKLSMGRPGIFDSVDLAKKSQFFIESLQLKNIKKSPWKDNEELKWWLDLFFIVLRDKICKKIIGNGCYQYLNLKINFNENVSLNELFIVYDKLQEIRRNIDLNLNKSIIWNYISNLLRSMING